MRARGRSTWLALALLATGCSEKGLSHDLLWKFVSALPTRRGALTSVVALDADRVVAVGYDRPEGLISNLPLSLVRNAGVWTTATIPAPAVGGSLQILSATRAEDGSVWACGRSNDNELDPSRLTPVVYRYAGGAWSEVPITGLPDLNGILLASISASGSGSALELRAVGSAQWGQRGVALRFAAGAWSADSLPPPAGSPKFWSLAALAHAPDGKWYAAGATVGGGANVLYVDDGTGWRPLAGPASFSSLAFTAVAFDPDGSGWFCANQAVGDSLEGVLLRYRSGAFTPTAIARRTPGDFHLNAIGFDAEGNGWAVGGRSGYLPFIAGSSGGGWTESVAEIEHEAGVTGGGELYAVTVIGPEAALAVGYKLEVDFKGLVEAEANVYQLVVKPVGEIDSRSPPLAPYR